MTTIMLLAPSDSMCSSLLHSGALTLVQVDRFGLAETAALYVAGALPESEACAYEAHFMECRECMFDVEIWRVIARHLRESPNQERLAE